MQKHKTNFCLPSRSYVFTEPEYRWNILHIHTCTLEKHIQRSFMLN